MRPSAVIEVVRCHTAGYRILMPTPDPEFLHLQLVRLFCIQSDVDMVESGMILPTGWLSQGVTSPCVVAVNLVAGSVASFKIYFFPINFGQSYPFFYRLTGCNWSPVILYTTMSSGPFSFGPKLLIDLCRTGMLSLLYPVQQISNYILTCS